MKRAGFILWLRSALFVSGFLTATLLHSLICLLVLPLLPLRARFHFAVLLNRFVIWWFGVSCGVRYRFEGLEQVRAGGAAVLMSNHQSEWETFYLQTLVSPLCTVLKRELLRIPLFGWCLGMLKPIAIDRRARNSALKQILAQGERKLRQGFWVLIFPEGTRTPPGGLSRFSKTAALLATAAGVPLIPIAHNAGVHWPAKGFLKYPGNLRLVAGPRIETLGRSAEEIHQEATAWIQAQMAQFSLDAAQSAVQTEQAA